MRDLTWNEVMLLLTESARRLHLAAFEGSFTKVQREIELIQEYQNQLIVLSNKEDN